MGPKKDTKGGKGKGKDTSDGDDKGKGKGLKAANSINVRHILVCIPILALESLSMFLFRHHWELDYGISPEPRGFIDTIQHQYT